jgi:hypothetical protein
MRSTALGRKLLGQRREDLQRPVLPEDQPCVDYEQQHPETRQPLSDDFQSLANDEEIVQRHGVVLSLPEFPVPDRSTRLLVLNRPQVAVKQRKESEDLNGKRRQQGVPMLDPIVERGRIRP